MRPGAGLYIYIYIYLVIYIYIYRYIDIYNAGTGSCVHEPIHHIFRSFVGQHRKMGCSPLHKYEVLHLYRWYTHTYTRAQVVSRWASQVLDNITISYILYHGDAISLGSLRDGVECLLRKHCNDKAQKPPRIANYRVVRSFHHRILGVTRPNPYQFGYGLNLLTLAFLDCGDLTATCRRVGIIPEWFCSPYPKYCVFVFPPKKTSSCVCPQTLRK